MLLQFALSNSDVVGQNFVENVPKIHKKAKILALFKRKNLKKRSENQFLTSKG